MNLKETPYYIGLDCGTSSIGFAVTDKEYNLLKAQNKDMWGSHLFDEANTAKERRIQRNARKRLERRNDRIKLLQSIFAEEISKIDPTFFLRLNESALWEEDRSYNNKQKFSLFNDKDYTDQDFKKEFPTIFHLRKALIDDTTEDPRLVYLACHNIIKNRGHFLFPGKGLASVQSVGNLLETLKEVYSSLFYDEEIQDELNFSSTEEIESILRKKRRSEKLDELQHCFFSKNEKRKITILRCILGYNIQAKKLFENDEYKEIPNIEFQKPSFEETDLPQLEQVLTEDEYILVETMKAIYDWSLLANIMEGQGFLSYAKVEQYNKNKEDLRKLKRVIKKYNPEEYKHFFYTKDAGTFSSYIGSINTNKLTRKKKQEESRRVKRSTTEAFYKEIKRILKNADEQDTDVIQILTDIENDNFYTLLRSFRNGVIPYQVNLQELQAILNNAKANMTWLEIKDKDGFSPIEKIESIMEYRIPYYVGPLTNNPNNKIKWFERKQEGKILPWTFDKVIDEDASAEAFITNLTNKCTYCTKEDVIPKNSLLYQNFMVLNEINNIKFNNEKISVEQKQTIYNKLFKKGNVTRNKIEHLAIAEGWIQKGEPLSISGIDTTIKSSLSSYLQFKDFIEKGILSNNDVESIIRWLTLFSDGGSIASKKIHETFKDKLSKEEIDRIARMKFCGWGTLSKKFLTGIEAIDPETGEYKNIIRLLWDTNQNLMEILYNPACEILTQLEEKEPINRLQYRLLEDLRLSPKVKRQIWQALRIVKEVEQIMEHKPEKVFIEVTREKEKVPKRKKSRKDDLLEKIKTTDEVEIIKELEKTEESLISKRDKLYLYFTQLGKCMYSGEPINLEELLNDNKTYDIDHIYPYSKSSDDSLENKVIVKAKLNREKTNIYPINEEIRINMTNFWKMLLNKKLITSEKYHRLTRNTPLTDSDLQGFINRQIVETSQATKALANILGRYFGEDTKIVYSKARRVSEFRDTFNIYKSRIVNDLHHAKDAYLNIVVGNTLNTKYTSAWFKRTPNFNAPYKNNIEGAWIADEDKTISLVKETMNKNSVLFTRQPEMRTGQLFDLNPKAKRSEKGMIPLKMTKILKEKLAKSEDKEATIKEWTDKYGGYNSLAISHFALIKHLDKKNTVYSFIRIPIIRAAELLNKDNLYKYCIEELKLKNPEIIRVKVLFNTLLSVDGFKMTLTGSANGGQTLLLESSSPLILNNEITRYVKKLEKYDAKKKQDKNYLIDSIYDEITKDKNEELYQLLINKSKLPIYKNRPANMSKLLTEGLDLFTKLTLEEQSSMLINLFNYFGMGNGLTNFASIGGSKAQGTLTLSSKIDPKKKKVYIIDQSITGIYEEKLELK